MDYLELLIFLLIFIVITLFGTYFWGVPAGLVGCVVISLYNVWACNVILSHHFRTGVIIFFQNLAVTVPVMLCVDQLFLLFNSDQGSSLRLLAYILIAYVFITAVFNWDKIIIFKFSDFIDEQRKINYFRKRHDKNESMSRKRKQAFKLLESTCHKINKSPDNLPEFFNLTTKLIARNNDPTTLAPAMTFFSSRLIVEGLDRNDCRFSESVFNHYIEKILPHTGSDKYKSNIIGNSLLLAIRCSMDSVADKVFDVLLKNEFSIDKVEDDFALYNLACYFAIKRQKDKMLAAIKQGLLHGREVNQYMTDHDFKSYWDDTDFLDVLQTGGNNAVSETT